MAITNIVTSLRNSQNLTTEDIQAHLDAQNALGYHLVGIDNLVGWYRFFWAKDEA